MNEPSIFGTAILAFGIGWVGSTNILGTIVPRVPALSDITPVFAQVSYMDGTNRRELITHTKAHDIERVQQRLKSAGINAKKLQKSVKALTSSSIPTPKPQPQPIEPPKYLSYPKCSEIAQEIRIRHAILSEKEEDLCTPDHDSRTWQAYGKYCIRFNDWPCNVVKKSESSLQTDMPAKPSNAERTFISKEDSKTYIANCVVLGDSVSFMSTGEGVPQTRLINFASSSSFVSAEGINGEKGTCTLKENPKGFRWIHCYKKGNQYVSYRKNGVSYAVNAHKAIISRESYRGGDCLIKI
jgi:hypothetical protein